MFRRLSRIFSHAYFHHRELFQLAEAETSLYARFVALCEKYDLVGTNLLVIPRSVVADAIDGKQTANDDDDSSDEDEDEDEDEEDEEEEEEEEEDAADERDSRRRDKGETGRRPHSLDRHPRPHKLDDLRSKVEGTVKGWTLLAGGQQTSTSNVATPTAEFNETSVGPNSASETYAMKPKPVRENTIQGSNASTARALGRSTLGRKGRGTMLWTSDTPESAASVPEQTDASASTSAGEGGAPLERTESVETAIMIDPENDTPAEAVTLPSMMTDDTADTEEPDVPESAVPKDEIELLEEEGKIPPLASSVSPLPPPGSGEDGPISDPASDVSKSDGKTEAEVEADEKEELQEIELDEPNTDHTSSASLDEATKSATSSGSTSTSTSDEKEPSTSAEEKASDESESGSGSGMDSDVVADTDKVLEHVDAGGAADEDPSTDVGAEKDQTATKHESAEKETQKENEKAEEKVVGKEETKEVETPSAA